MSNLLRLDPFFTAFEPIFSAAAAPRRTAPRTFSPELEIRETDDSFVLVADMPGVSEDALDISVEGRELSIAGSRSQSELVEGQKVHLRERRFGGFARKFTLPDEVDAESITAALQDGVLTLTVPKLPQSQPRKIPVRGAAELKNAG